jgi:putative ABC transport system permease protein
MINFLAIRHFFKIAWRNLLKRKGYSIINIAGLGVGLAICMLIVLFIRQEMNYDQFIDRHKDIYRLVVERRYPGRSTSYSMIPQSYAFTIKAECPEVEAAVRLFNFLGGASVQFKVDDRRFEEKNVLFADSTFFKVFNHPILAGDRNDPLGSPLSVVMTASTAIKYFGSIENAIGKRIIPEGNDPQPLQIQAVCADWPETSHFTFDLLETTAGLPNFQRENYVNFAAHTYLLLHPQNQASQIESRMPDILRKYAAGNIAAAFSMPFEEFFKAGNGYRYYAQPLTSIHLESQLEGELKANGNLQAVYIFMAIAVIILILAIINFINLSTARSSERAREVGIRKTYGSDKKILILQFLTESTLVSIGSFLLAIVLVYLLLPSFNSFSASALSFSQLTNPSVLALCIALTIGTGILAGIYPASSMAAFKPIAVLKGRTPSGSQPTTLRNGLVVFQFAISVILIICTLVVNQQMNYMTGNTLGYDKELVLMLNRTDVLGEKTKTFKDELLRLPVVANVTGASAFPGDNNYFGISWRSPGAQEPMTGRGIFTDERYQSTFDLELSAGRYFSTEFGTDSLAVVINEAAAKELGLQNPIGAILTTEEDFLNQPNSSPSHYKIIGILKDYNYQSLHLPIVPLVFTSNSRFHDVAFKTAVKLKAGNVQQAISEIEKTWSTFVPDRPLDYQFLDDQITNQYLAELRTQRIFTFFAGLAIFIACIGLFGLAAYSCQQRMKELSVRKVLGASPIQLIVLLTVHFIRLIAIALLIAFPLAWYLMHRWLGDFSYRVSITPQHFLIATGLAFAVAMITLSAQTLRAALANPIKALRSE